MDAVEAMDGWRAAMVSHARYPLEFTPSELADAAGGAIVKRRERIDGADRVVGVAWTPASRDALWIAIQDDAHFALVEGLVDEQLAGTTPAEKLLYQRIDLPWPFADRQWVIDVRNNLGLWRATDGGVWERTWGLSDARGAANEAADAVWVSVNDGGWLLFDVAGGTLLVYHVRSHVDGNIPNELATRWCFATLDDMLRGIIDRAASIPSHYVAPHEILQRPDGSPIRALGR
jgi:hypothetical protein